MQTIFKLMKFIVKRYYYSRVIRKLDSKSDAVIANSHLTQHGYQVFSVSDLFSDEDFSEKLCSQCKKSGRSSIDMDWQLPKVFWEQILCSEPISHAVKKYLGDNARLDDAYLKTIKDDLTSVSEGWHNDNVGYRLKLFIVFDVEGTPAPTVLVPKSRPNLYRFNLLEDTRRVIFKKISSANRHNQVVVKYNAGTCLLFDTNIEHRGGYSESKGVRHCIVVEFINKTKADKILNFSPCGPKQGRGKIQILAEEKFIDNSELLDRTMLRKIDDKMYEYG